MDPVFRQGSEWHDGAQALVQHLQDDYVDRGKTIMSVYDDLGVFGVFFVPGNETPVEGQEGWMQLVYDAKSRTWEDVAP